MGDKWQAKRIKRLLKNRWSHISLHDLRQASVNNRHHFELSDDSPMYAKNRRMAPTHQKLVKEEIEKMLEEGIIRLASSAWSFMVVIATKKDVKPRFCVYCRPWSASMKADR